MPCCCCCCATDLSRPTILSACGPYSFCPAVIRLLTNAGSVIISCHRLFLAAPRFLCRDRFNTADDVTAPAAALRNRFTFCRRVHGRRVRHRVLVCDDFDFVRVTDFSIKLSSKRCGITLRGGCLRFRTSSFVFGLLLTFTTVECKFISSFLLNDNEVTAVAGACGWCSPRAVDGCVWGGTSWAVSSGSSLVSSTHIGRTWSCS